LKTEKDEEETGPPLRKRVYVYIMVSSTELIFVLVVVFRIFEYKTIPPNCTARNPEVETLNPEL